MKRNEQSPTKLVNAAFRQAALKIIERAAQAGTPIIVWENDQIKRLEPREASNLLKTGRKKA